MRFFREVDSSHGKIVIQIYFVFTTSNLSCLIQRFVRELVNSDKLIRICSLENVVARQKLSEENDSNKRAALIELHTYIRC